MCVAPPVGPLVNTVSSSHPTPHPPTPGRLSIHPSDKLLLLSSTALLLSDTHPCKHPPHHSGVLYRDVKALLAGVTLLRHTLAGHPLTSWIPPVGVPSCLLKSLPLGFTAGSDRGVWQRHPHTGGRCAGVTQHLSVAMVPSVNGSC